MSIGTRKHFNLIIVASIVIAAGVAFAVLTGPIGKPARPGEVTNARYKEITKDLEKRCPQLTQLVANLINNDGMISLKESAFFEHQCAKAEKKMKKLKKYKPGEYSA